METTFLRNFKGLTETCRCGNIMMIGDFKLTVNNKNLGVCKNTINL